MSPDQARPFCTNNRRDEIERGCIRAPTFDICLDRFTSGDIPENIPWLSISRLGANRVSESREKSSSTEAMTYEEENHAPEKPPTNE